MPKHYKSKGKYVNFENLALHKRAKQVISLKGDIRRNHWNTGMDYYSHHVQVGQHPDINYSSWNDIMFLSRNKFIYWNATIVTVVDQLITVIEDFIGAKIIPYFEIDMNPRLGYVRDGLPKHEELNGMDVFDYVHVENKRILNRFMEGDFTDIPEIYEEYKFEKNYRYGMGLTMVVNVNNLTINNINQEIKRFLNSGEKEWKSTTPVPLETIRQYMINAPENNYSQFSALS